VELIFTAHFLYRVLAAILKMADISKILKMQNCSSNGDLSLCQILCLYHYSFRSYQLLHFQNFRDICHFQNGCQNTVLKMGGKNSTLPDIIKICYVGHPL
jgi:hypothetical protein